MEAAQRAPLTPTADAKAAKAELVGQTNKRFNGVFFAAFQFSGAFGLLSASLLLTFLKGSNATTYLFIGLSVCCGIALLVLGLALPNLPALEEDEDEDAMGFGAPAPALKPKKAEVTILETLKLCFTDARMYLIVPNILYNGMSLAYMWYLYSSLVWNTALGTSFVGYGSAVFYLVNSLSTIVTSKIAARYGQVSTAMLATLAQAAFFALFIFYTVPKIDCLESGCGPAPAGGEARSCFKPPPGPNGTVIDLKDYSFPTSCNPAITPHHPLFDPSAAAAVAAAAAPNGTTPNGTHPGHHGGNTPCAVCVPYDDHAGQECSSSYIQCQVLHGDAKAVDTSVYVVLFLGAILFAVADSVWEGQIPAVLQTLFDAASGSQPSAMANLKLWQSLGVAIVFGLAYMDSLPITGIILIACLLLSTAALMYAHYRVANLDTGELRR